MLKVWKGWVTRSLAVGAVATVIDLSLGASLLALGAPTRVSAMTGTLVGSTLSFLGNRYFSFREPNPKLAAPALRYAAVTLIASLIHGQLVVTFRDRWGIAYVPSKMLADLCVFTFAQLLVLRYIVFPRAKS